MKVKNFLFSISILITIILLGGLCETVCPPEPEPDTNDCSVTKDRIDFAGRTWIVRNEPTPNDPGKNYFSNSKCNVWIDSQERLHLKITKRNNIWYCAEVYSIDNVGYGEYVFYVSTKLDEIDKNIVFGLFTYDNTTCSTDANSEIDIEFAKWGEFLDFNPLEYGVQPKNDGLGGGPYHERIHSNILPLIMTGDFSTHVFKWESNKVSFSSFHGHGNPTPYSMDNWVFNSTNPGRNVWCSDDNAWSELVVIPKPSSNTVVDINLYLYDSNDDGYGDPPTNGKDYEVIIEGFEYIPYNQNNEYLYLVDGSVNKVFKLDLDVAINTGNGGSAVVSSFNSPGSSSYNIDGLAYDGTNWFVAHNKDNKVYKVNPSGTVIGSFWSPGKSAPDQTDDYGPYGLDWYQGKLWLVDMGHKKLYKINTTKALNDGNCNSAIEQTIHTFDFSYSIVFADPYLWTSNVAGRIDELSVSTVLSNGTMLGNSLLTIQTNQIIDRGIAHDGSNIWVGGTGANANIKGFDVNTGQETATFTKPSNWLGGFQFVRQ